ncbi:hypothetical protein A9G11_01540 [Gilliamella sp. wkB108]|uniref:sigma 54-interacting transcriptional regulator n=1 Tax=Gilliamella sp. wkB108 TaxID=3120256 RepID=UPI00080E617F|nr:sigma 54-interacting transcriptional regulator [Gilliamella apicola]OCG26035.1 hypothetical protein A9G11_01540 [Gilliamella apicola]
MQAKHQFFDISSINQAVFACLDNINKLCKNFVDLDRINIIIETLSPSTLALFHIDCQTEQKGVWSQSSANNDNVFHCELSSIPMHYNHTTYSLFLADTIPAIYYQDVQNCYHFSLYWSDDCHCALHFLRTNDNGFTADEINTLQQLAELVAKIVTNLLAIEQINSEKKFYEHEHLRDHILVNIINTAISIRDLEKMLKLVAQEIIEFFNIDYIGLVVPTNGQAQQQLYSTFRLSDTKFSQQCTSLNLPQSFIKKLATSPTLEIYSIEELHAQYSKNTILSMMLDVGLNSLYCLPLNLANKQKGALLIAHRHADIFNSDNIDLFKRIADRITIGVDNIEAYQHVSNLNHSLTNENRYLSEEIPLFDSYKDIVGQSNAIQRVLEQVEMVADSTSSVLLLGETGTGKELFAKAIHQRSSRRNKRMIKINCSAVPANLLESELFGHERGAFTNANAQRIGRFELAHGSTLLLDEIGDIPLELQPKLLRVLQEKEIERLGSNKTIPIDARVIAATNCDLEKMVADRTFRADLYYRLNVFPIHIPPLRHRKEDIPALAQFFTQKFAHQMKRDIDSIASSTLQQLCDYDWPGNVRELANVIERAVILTKGHSLNINMQSFLVNDHPILETPIIRKVPQPDLDNNHFSHNDLVQREKIIQVLKETNGIIAGPKGAAIKLGLKRTTLLSRMQKLNISAKEVIQEE